MPTIRSPVSIVYCTPRTLVQYVYKLIDRSPLPYLPVLLKGTQKIYLKNKDEENVVIKIAWNIFVLLSLVLLLRYDNTTLIVQETALLLSKGV
jgi:hypothetical protein